MVEVVPIVLEAGGVEEAMGSATMSEDGQAILLHHQPDQALNGISRQAQRNLPANVGSLPQVRGFSWVSLMMTKPS